jgi:hypothetical protein
LREEVPEPGAIQAPDAIMAMIFARQEYDDSVLCKEPDDIFDPVEVDIIAIGPVQPTDRVDVLQLPDTSVESVEAREQICGIHVRHRSISWSIFDGIFVCKTNE